jgi:ketosteroid isomerase-like protein
VSARIVVMVSLLLAGCGSAPAPCAEAPGARTVGEKRTAEVRKKIEDTDARMMAAFKRGDLAGCMQLYAPDAIVWDETVEQSVHGRAAIADTWRPLMGKVKDATLTVDEVVVFGSLAYEADHGTVTLDASPPMTVHGKSLLIWQEQPDGSWVVIRESGNSKTVN